MKAILMGLGIGVGLGILFAPNTGERTRSKVRGKLNEWSHRFSLQVDRAKKTVDSQANELSKRVSERRKEQNERSASKRQPKTFAEGELMNTLSRDDLMTVNGIGPVLADRIISGRPYSSIRDLVDRGIIAQSTLDEFERQFGSRLKEPA
jgi:DNA uptake protein ComE-like DNA-binding protein